MLEQILTSLIGALCGSLATYAIVKHLLNPQKIIEETICMLTEDSEMQKRIYMLGAILGNGARQGLGFAAGSKKFKFEDIIGMAISNFFGQQQQNSVPEVPKYPAR